MFDRDDMHTRLVACNDKNEIQAVLKSSIKLRDSIAMRMSPPIVYSSEVGMRSKNRFLGFAMVMMLFVSVHTTNLPKVALHVHELNMSSYRSIHVVVPNFHDRVMESLLKISSIDLMHSTVVESCIPKISATKLFLTSNTPPNTGVLAPGERREVAAHAQIGSAGVLA